MDINTLNNEALAPAAVAVTSGASPVTLDPNVRYYAVTTGGTAGVEVLDLPLLPLPVDGVYNPPRSGSQIVISLVTQTNPGDIVKIKVNGQENNLAMLSGLVGGQLVSGSVQGGVLLNYPGSAVALVWLNDGWYIDPVGTNFTWDAGTAILGVNVNLDAGTDVSGDGSSARLKGGSAVTNGHVGAAAELLGGDSTNFAAGNAVVNGGQASTTGDGGDAIVGGGASLNGQAGSARVIGGSSSGTGIPGDVVIQPGSNFDDTVHGRVLAYNLPTVAPAEPGQLWNNSGVVNIGAGSSGGGAVVEDFGVQTPWGRPNSADAIAWQGVAFTATADCTVYAVGATLTARVVGWTYRAKIVVVNTATGDIVSVVASSAVSPAATTTGYAKMLLPLTAPVVLTTLPAGQVYAAIFGVTNQTTTTSLKNGFASDGMQFATAPFAVYGLVSYASLDPVAATGGNIGAATVTYGIGVVIGV